MSRMVRISAVMISMTVILVLAVGCSAKEPSNPDGSEAVDSKINDIKNPEKYTWEEFEALDDAQKEAFFEEFPTDKDFDQWMVEAKRIYNSPWESEDKQPSGYTWEEFEQLTDTQKEYFFESFAVPEDFEAWMIQARKVYNSPWLQGGKQPAEYTWDEFEALTEAQKEAFFESFDKAEEFEQWLERERPKE